MSGHYDQIKNDVAFRKDVVNRCGVGFDVPASLASIEDWGKLLGDSAAVTAMLDRLLHHGHILKCGPRSWRTKLPAE